MLQGPVCKLTSRGSGRRAGGGTIESGPIPNRSTREACCARMEVSRNPAARMLENAAIVAAKVAMVEHRGAARKIGGMVIEHGAAVPVGGPGVETPAVVSKQSDRNADGGKSESQTYGQAKRWRSHIKTTPGRNPSAVYAPRVVVGHVHHGGIHGSNQNLRAIVINALLRSGSQIARLLRLDTRGLDSVHYVARLIVVSVAERGRPAVITRHVIQHGREGCERLDAWVPGHAVGNIRPLLRRQPGVLLRPGVGVIYLLGISGSSQYLRHQRVWV